MNRRDFLMSAAVGAMVIAMAAPPGALGAGKALTIMAGVGGLEFPFFVIMMDKFKAEAEAIGGITLIVSDGQNSATKQTADVEAAIVQKVDAIVFSPLDVNALVPAIEAAIAANIPVVTVDRRVDGVDGILGHIGADNVAGGEAQAKAIIAKFPDGATIFNLQGGPGASAAIDRNKGLHNILDPMSDKYKIVFEQTANWMRDQALSVTEAGFAAHGKPDVINTANDDMALGVVEAAKLAGYNDIAIYGFDALPAALEAVRDGTLAGTVDQLPGEQAAMALKMVSDFVRDGVKPAQKTTLLTPIVITKDNLPPA